MSSIRPQDRASFLYLHLCRRSPLPYSTLQPPSAPLLRPCPEGSQSPPRRSRRQRPNFFFSGDCVSARDLSVAIAASCPRSPMAKSIAKPPPQSPASPEHCCTPSSSLSMSTSAPPPKRVRPGRAAAPKPQQNMPNTNPPKINTHISASK